MDHPKRNPDAPDAQPRRFFLLLPVINLVWIAVFLSNYSNVWVLPEAYRWRGYIARKPHALISAFRGAFNWRLFEGEPRITRPLASFMEIMDGYVRSHLWKYITPYPAFSITYLFTLIVVPILLYKVLRSLQVSQLLAICGVTLYLSNPGMLSLLAMSFRTGKAMACAAIIAVLWRASRLRKPSLAEVWPLYAFLFVSFFFDETALAAYPALLLLFPRVVFSTYGSATAFFSIPLVYAATLRWLLPVMHLKFGFRLPPDASYNAFDRFKSYVTFSASGSEYSQLTTQFLANTRIALSDNFGLIHPGVPASTGYNVVFAGIVLSLAVLAALLVRRIIAFRKDLRGGIREASSVIRSAAFLGVCLCFHTLLLGSIVNGIWGIYWYGAFMSVAFVIATITLLQYLHVRSLFAIGFVLLISAGTYYVFPATNRAYKLLHYYPYRPNLLTSVFQNKVDRFRLADIGPKDSDLRAFSRALARRDSNETVRGAPIELLYLTYEVDVNPQGADCGGVFWKFDLVRSASGSRVECREPIVSDADDVDGFLGSWNGVGLGKAHIEHASGFIAINEWGAPASATVDGTQIRVLAWDMKGQMSSDGRSVVWTNGAVWQRREKSSAGTAFEGSWWSNGACLIRAASPVDFVVTDQSNNRTVAATVLPGGTILAPNWGTFPMLTGQLAPNRKRITWATGEVWTH